MITENATAGNPAIALQVQLRRIEAAISAQIKLIYVLMDEETRLVDRIRSARAALVMAELELVKVQKEIDAATP